MFMGWYKMFYLEGNEINITRGDTALIDFTLDNHEFVDGDVVYFSVKRSTKDTSYIINKEIREKSFTIKQKDFKELILKSSFVVVAL